MSNIDPKRSVRADIHVLPANVGRARNVHGIEDFKQKAIEIEQGHPKVLHSRTC
jgi:hypothetical protein